MSCTNPILAYPPKLGKYALDKRYRILGNYEKLDKFDISSVDSDGEVVKPVLLPCGKCISCRLAYSREWATRIMCELKKNPPGYFITLTYDDEHLPTDIFKSQNSGSDAILPYLNPSDTRDWLKRLRKRIYPATVRFFLAGEYGSKSFRPHYHVCLFGYEIPDLIQQGHNFQNDFYYRSPLIEETWSKGNVTIGDLTFQSASYVARYCTKKVDDKHVAFIEDYSLPKEFTRMSRRPGIGYDYISDDLFNVNDTIYLANGMKSKIPRYFLKKLGENEDNEKYIAKIKARREDVSTLLENRSNYELPFAKKQRFAESNRVALKRSERLSRDL